MAAAADPDFAVEAPASFPKLGSPKWLCQWAAAAFVRTALNRRRSEVERRNYGSFQSPPGIFVFDSQRSVVSRSEAFSPQKDSIDGCILLHRRSCVFALARFRFSSLQSEVECINRSRHYAGLFSNDGGGASGKFERSQRGRYS